MQLIKYELPFSLKAGITAAWEAAKILWQGSEKGKDKVATQ